MTPIERELLVDHIAGVAAEDAAASARLPLEEQAEFRAYVYAVMRKVPEFEGGTALDEMADHEVLSAYTDRFDFDPEIASDVVARRLSHLT